jgi:4-alpha-glucanotransferase
MSNSTGRSQMQNSESQVRSIIEERRGGILLHPTSLPGPHGCGTIGNQAEKWLDWMASAGMRLWQFLPLGPTGYGDSPYQSFSAFAGNPNLIDLEVLVDQGVLDAADLDPIPDWPAAIDFGRFMAWKNPILNLAAERFKQRADPSRIDSYDEFVEQQSDWLEDYALFRSLKEAHAGAVWTRWPDEFARREPAALERARAELASVIERERILQFIFRSQWNAVRERASELGITLIGDMPIFVAHDSADVWSHRGLFRLDSNGMPVVVAGVPPDYFSATGQRWGNPLYDWEVMERNGYAWWVGRLGSALELTDVVRLDHFRGFAAYWEIPAEEETAVNGRWVEGPGRDLLDRLFLQLGRLPLLAEDLGVITPDVEELRDEFNLPGMRVLQFGLEADPDNPYLPHNYIGNCIAYTGTHDNDTSAGWYQNSTQEIKDFCLRYLRSDGTQIVRDMMRSIWASSAGWVVVPMQDPLELGSETRMNTPGQAGNSWSWRLQKSALTGDLAQELSDMNWLYGRTAPPPRALQD